MIAYKIKSLKYLSILFTSFLYVDKAMAVDSYRFLHVTIDTPWYIFLFLLPIVMSPFILMAILYWRFSNENKEENKDSENQ